MSPYTPPLMESASAGISSFPAIPNSESILFPDRVTPAILGLSERSVYEVMLVILRSADDLFPERETPFMLGVFESSVYEVTPDIFKSDVVLSPVSATPFILGVFESSV